MVRSKGSTAVRSGHSGGNPLGCPPGHPGIGNCDAGGYGHGADARTLPGNKEPTVWTRGKPAEAHWGIHANHGGGYR